MMLPYFQARLVLRIFFKLFTRYSVYNEDRVPKDGGVVIVSNHVSYIDPLIVGISLTRRATFIAKEELFNNTTIMGEFVTKFSIPVKRDNPQPSTVKEAVRRLRANEIIVLFPQGTRQESFDSDAELKRGASVMSKLSSSPIVPAYISGSDKILPPGSKFPRPYKLRINFGQPIDTKELSDDEISRKIIESMIGLKEELD